MGGDAPGESARVNRRETDGRAPRPEGGGETARRANAESTRGGAAHLDLVPDLLADVPEQRAGDVQLKRRQLLHALVARVLRARAMKTGRAWGKTAAAAEYTLPPQLSFFMHAAARTV